MRTTKIAAVASFSLAAVGLVAAASAQEAYRAVPLTGEMPTMSPADTALDMSWSTIDGSGGPLTGSGGLLLEGTVGQPDAGPLAGAGMELIGGFWGFVDENTPCYANCDGSTTAPVLNVNDFQCFLNKYAVGDSYANCDGSTVPPVLNINDFLCFLNKYAAGCP